MRMIATAVLFLLLVTTTALAQAPFPVELGTPDAIASNVDNNSTLFAIKGGLMAQPILVGPAFGVGICGGAYRVTGETNMDPSYVTRCKSYMWEDDGQGSGGLKWLAILNSQGLCVGCRVNDGVPYPSARLDVREKDGNNTAHFLGNAGTYLRVDAAGNSLDGCFIFDVNGTPAAAFGRCGGLFGSSYQNAITYGKYVGGVGWAYIGTLMTW